MTSNELVSVCIPCRDAAPYLPAAFVGLAALGLLAAGASPAWWITALVAVGFGLVVFMATYSESR